MADISKEKAVQLAREAGATEIECSAKLLMFGDEIHALAQAAYKLGRNAGLEEAIPIARSATHNAGDEYGHGYNKAAAEITRAIESLKDNTP